MMDRITLNLTTPPITEACFSFQFEPLEELHLGVRGLLWSEFRSEYPTVKRLPALEHTIEKFGVIKRSMPQIRLMTDAPDPRLQFFSASEDSLIQLQQDRFVMNWLKSNSNKYPGFPKLKEMYSQRLKTFLDFLNKENLPAPSLNQIELTYVNRIEQEGMAASDIFVGIVGQELEHQSFDLESFSINLAHILKHNDEAIGRIYTSITTDFNRDQSHKIYDLRFTARTSPIISEAEGALCTLDVLSDAINKSFKSMIKEDLLKKWSK